MLYLVPNFVYAFDVPMYVRMSVCTTYVRRCSEAVPWATKATPPAKTGAAATAGAVAKAAPQAAPKAAAPKAVAAKAAAAAKAACARESLLRKRGSYGQARADPGAAAAAKEEPPAVKSSEAGRSSSRNVIAMSVLCLCGT